MTEKSALQMRVRVLLSLQRALPGKVTPSLRGVAVSWYRHQVGARFIYNGDDADHVDLLKEAKTLVLGDFEDDVATDFASEVSPKSTPLALASSAVWVYLRRE